ncbi:MAG: hypothetical protein ACREK9_09175 [Candidatus Rokuibacteriota bacterium]
MGRVLYIVAKEQPLLCGYLMATVGAQSDDGHLVEIKVDERRGERRLSREARDPERRRGERRLRPSLDSDLGSRGYATVVLSDADQSRTDEPAPEPAMAWRPRSTWRHRAARAGRRSRRLRWGLIVVLLAVVGVSIVVARSIQWTADSPPPAPQVEEEAPPPPPQIVQKAPAPPQIVQETPAPPQIVEAPPPPPASKAETVLPPAPPLPPSSPSPARIVTTRSSGIVLSVDSGARALVLEDRGAAAGRLRVELAPDARVVLSERDDQPENLSHPFKDTVIGLSGVRSGDYVVVEMRGPEGKELARSVVVTFRPN